MHMKHPQQEAWIEYLYGESAEPQRIELDLHLQKCAECRSRIDGWRKTLGNLDATTKPLGQPVSGPKPVRWQLGAAAVILLLIGIAVGRFSVSTDALRSEIVAELNQGMEDQLSTLANQIQTARLEDREVTLQLLEEFELRRVAGESQMRRELETVAVNTQTRLQVSEHQLRVFNENMNGLVPVTYVRPN